MVEGVTSHGYLTRVAKMLWERYTMQTLQGTEALCVWRFLFGDLDRKRCPSSFCMGMPRGRGELSQPPAIPLQHPGGLSQPQGSRSP